MHYEDLVLLFTIMELAAIMLMLSFILSISPALGAPTMTQLAKRDDKTVTVTKKASTKTVSFTLTETRFTSSTSTVPGTCATQSTCSIETPILASKSTELSAPYSTTTMAVGFPYGDYFYPNVTWNPSCQMVQFCNATDFEGMCITVPLLIRNPTSGGCNLDPVRSCLLFPAHGEDWYGFFKNGYGDSLQTLSIRPGTGLKCTTFSDTHCYLPTISNMTSNGYSDLAARDMPTNFNSFHCWPNDETEPNYNGVMTTTSSLRTYTTVRAPSPRSTLSPTMITVVPAAASSIEAALDPYYFDPFVDQLLLCGSNSAATCAALNGTDGHDCTNLWDFSSTYDMIAAEYAASGYYYTCTLYEFVHFVDPLEDLC